MRCVVYHTNIHRDDLTLPLVGGARVGDEVLY